MRTADAAQLLRQTHTAHIPVAKCFIVSLAVEEVLELTEQHKDYEDRAQHYVPFVHSSCTSANMLPAVQMLLLATQQTDRVHLPAA